MAFKQLTEAERDAVFRQLATALDHTPVWATERKTTKRTATAGEFMFMGRSAEGLAMFKHGVSRNYVYLDADGVLEVPDSETPFMQGFFPE